MPKAKSSLGPDYLDVLRKQLTQAIQQAIDTHSAMDTCVSSIESLIEQAAKAVSTYHTSLAALLSRAKSTSIDGKTLAEIEDLVMAFNAQYLQLQSQMQNETRSYAAVSKIMKTKHDTVKNSIGNIR